MKYLLQKYLLLLLLVVPAFVIVPLFAIVPANEVHDRADQVNAEKVKDELPTLLKEIEDSIDMESKLGLYSCSVDVSGHDDAVIRKVSDILSEEDYHVSTDSGVHFRNRLFIEW